MFKVVTRMFLRKIVLLLKEKQLQVYNKILKCRLRKDASELRIKKDTPSLQITLFIENLYEKCFAPYLRDTIRQTKSWKNCV